jgi:hypothetical protein
MKLSSQERDRLVQQGVFLLKTFHEHKARQTNEVEFWRGNLAGFRHTVESLYCRDAASNILRRLRQETKLRIPHSGPDAGDGGYFGMDMEADL